MKAFLFAVFFMSSPPTQISELGMSWENCQAALSITRANRGNFIPRAFQCLPVRQR